MAKVNPLKIVAGTAVWARTPTHRIRSRSKGVVHRLDGRDAAVVHWADGSEQLCLLSDLCTDLEQNLAARVYECYNNIAPDCWGEQPPAIGVFVDVMLDQMCHGPHGNSGTNAEEQAAWDSLSRAARTRIIRSVGP